MTKYNHDGVMPSEAASDAEEERISTLVVGDISAWQTNGQRVPDIDGFFFVDAHALDAAIIRKVAPQVVLSSLVAGSSDAVEIARKLGNMNFEGVYRVLTRTLPRPELVIQEVSTVAPNLNFDVIALAEIFPDL